MKKHVDKINQKRKDRKKKKEISKIPRITNENVAEHREDIISGAQKYIYPLRHSKHRIVVLSTSILLLVVLVFSITSVVFLYRFQTTSAFWYQVTKVIPFPVARSGDTFIAYENYLFELEHYIHYYENQQQLSFESEAGKAQLESYKERALTKIVNDAYIKMIAQEQGITVSDQEISEQIRIAREQNRFGSNDRVFEDVLREFWDWSIDDFRRSLGTEILEQKVVRALDSDAQNRATDVLGQLAAGREFAEVAAAFSDDIQTRENGGDFGFVNKSNRNVSQQTVDTLYNLDVGQTSDIAIVPHGTGYALAIVQKLEEKDDEVRGAYIIIQLKDINELLNDRKEQNPYRLYMNPVE